MFICEKEMREFFPFYKKYALQILAIYILTVMFNTIAYIGGKYGIEALYNLDIASNRIYPYMGIFLIYYALKHLKDKNFAFTLLYTKKENIIGKMLLWLAVAILVGKIIDIPLLMINDFIYGFFSHFEVGSIPRIIANLAVADAIKGNNLLFPFIIANMMDKLCDKGITLDGKDKIYKSIRSLKKDERIEKECKIGAMMLLVFVGISFVSAFISLLYYGNNIVEDLSYAVMVAFQLVYIFVLGMKGSYVGLGYVIFASLSVVYELNLIQMGEYSYNMLLSIITMPPRVCANGFSLVMNYFMQGGFDDISRYHSYLYVVPGVLIFISLYFMGVLVHYIQKYFHRTVDKCL